MDMFYHCFAKDYTSLIVDYIKLLPNRLVCIRNMTLKMV